MRLPAAPAAFGFQLQVMAETVISVFARTYVEMKRRISKPSLSAAQPPLRGPTRVFYNDKASRQVGAQPSKPKLSSFNPASTVRRMRLYRAQPHRHQRAGRSDARGERRALLLKGCAKSFWHGGFAARLGGRCRAGCGCTRSHSPPWHVPGRANVADRSCGRLTWSRGSKRRRRKRAGEPPATKRWRTLLKEGKGFCLTGRRV